MATRTPDRQEGFALVMVLILSVLLYVVVAELVTSARMSRFTGENDALLARMRNHMRYTLFQVEESLLDDLQSGAEEGAGGAGPLGGAGAAGGAGGAGGAGASGGAGAAPGGGEGNDASSADSSQDAWFKSQGYADNDLTTYVWIEDENRKFNILSLVSPDEEFARESKARFIRLIDYLREGTPFDLSPAHGEQFANRIIEWIKGQGRTAMLPRPLLKSDEESERDFTLPLHLDEVKLLDGFTDEIFYDHVFDNRLMLGLESVLTIYTSLAADPGDPDKRRGPGGASPTAPGGTAGSGPGASGGAGASSGQGADPIGEGIRININTASRPVLRCLFSDAEIPPAAIEALLRYRNEEEPPPEGEEAAAPTGLVEENPEPVKKAFAEVADLDKLPEFMNLANPEVKNKFFELTTTHSHVFTVHMASLFKRNEERRIFVIRRAASVLVRIEDGEESKIYPIIRLEERSGLRVVPIDFPEEYEQQLRMRDEFDEFAREERMWNPFFLEFYKPRDQR